MRISEQGVTRFCGLMIIFIIILAIGMGKARCQDYLVYVNVVDTVYYEGRELTEPSYYNVKEYNQYFNCIYNNHDWVYPNGKPESSGERICRYCLRWERYHTNIVVKRKETEFDKLKKRITVNRSSK